MGAKAFWMVLGAACFQPLSRRDKGCLLWTRLADSATLTGCGRIIAVPLYDLKSTSIVERPFRAVVSGSGHKALTMFGMLQALTLINKKQPSCSIWRKDFAFDICFHSYRHHAP